MHPARGPGVGNTWTATFHPKAVTGNANFSALNQFWDFGGNSWTPNGASFTSTFQPAIHGGIGWNVFIVNNMPSYVRITGQSPALLTPTTPNITLVGQIKNPWTQSGQENCVFTFRMVGLVVSRSHRSLKFFPVFKICTLVAE